MRTDSSYDRFGTPVEKRYSKKTNISYGNKSLEKINLKIQLPFGLL